MFLLRRSIALALVCAVLTAAPAVAQTRDVEDAAAESVAALQSEVFLLVELGAFDEVPPTLTSVHRAWVSHTNGFTRDGLLKWLYEVDADGAAMLEQLTTNGMRPSPAVSAALGRIRAEDRVRLESGSTISIPPGDYVAALQSLRSAISDAIVPIDVPRTSATAPSAPGSGATDVRVPSESPPVRADADYPWIPVTLALVSVVLIGLGMVMAGRRRTGPSAVAGAFDRLLDAGRRMAGALDRREIAAIAVEEALALGNAQRGAFIHVRAGRLTLGHQAGDFVDDRFLERGALARAAATGRAIRIVSNDEPAITALPAALLAVPVIGEGSVTGVLLVIRPDDRPFTDAEDSVIGQLAPMVGSAMAAADTHDSVAALSRTDPLTGLGNRRSLDNDLAAALLALTDGRYLGVVMLDVDHFKQFNDRHGHTAGDQALKAVGAVIAAQIRLGDAAYRYGGEEFALLLRDVRPDQATEVAERVRRAVAELGLPGVEEQPGGALTISIGVAVVAGGGVDAAVAAADQALYDAKAQGRDRVVVAAGIPAA